jgi:SAM-dependent methyltransferase
MTTGAAPSIPTAEELVGRLLEATIGALDIFSVYLGEQLGYYRALAEGSPLTSVELAARSGTQERYCREWLEQQTTTGIVVVADASAAPTERRYSLPAGYADVLVNPESEMFVAPVGRFLALAVAQAPALLNAYREGGGVSWSDFGELARESQADFNRPFYQHSLVPGFISQIPGLDTALNTPGARIAEIGFGGGWASIAMAKAYPTATVDGFEIDGPSVEMARKNLADSGIRDRVTFHHRDAADAGIDGQCDLVCAFECIHDMPDPVSVLRTMRRLARPGGTVLVMDERVGDDFGKVGDFNERLLYGFSLAVCLPDGMSHQPSVGTGTVMRPATFRKYAVEAGFSSVEILPLKHDLFCFYRLVP